MVMVILVCFLIGFADWKAADIGIATATVFDEKSKQGSHPQIVDRVMDVPPFPARVQKPGFFQSCQMEGHPGGRNVEALCDCAGRKTLVSLHHQQPESRQPVFLGESPKRHDCVI
jgi:hypothetical protein